MAILPTPFIWGDDLFDADPIAQGPFEAGLSDCDWTGDRLNGALYMTTSWIAQIAACIPDAATASDILTSSNPDHVLTVQNIALAVCVSLLKKGGQSFSAQCGTVIPATGSDGDIFVQFNAAGDNVVSVSLWADGAWQDVTADLGDDTCFTCPDDAVWCFDGTNWMTGADAVSEGPFASGQNPSDWFFSAGGAAGSGIVTLPSGPTPNGYWELQSTDSDAATITSTTGSYTVAAGGVIGNNTHHGVSPVGDTVDLGLDAGPPVVGWSGVWIWRQV